LKTAHLDLRVERPSRLAKMITIAGGILIALALLALAPVLEELGTIIGKAVGVLLLLAFGCFTFVMSGQIVGPGAAMLLWIGGGITILVLHRRAAKRRAREAMTRIAERAWSRPC
jgi:hypothetical protein